jgi:uncharacterized protein YdhG (YjbR/CyaY superfamily)
MPEAVIKTIDDYIAQYPPELAERLGVLRDTIRSAAPDAAETISWGMPTFYLHGNLVHFAAHKKHIGLYPGEEGIACFKDRFGAMTFSKGAVQFPNNQPLPLELVADIVAFRAAQNREAALKKKPEKSKRIN